MDQTAFSAEPLIRLGCFLGILAAMAVWEWWAPRRPRTIGRVRRWPNNFGLVVLNTVLVRVLLPFAGVGMAFYARGNEWGLFNRLPLPDWLSIAAAAVLLDLTIYGQHLLFHAVPALWRLHRMHHADLEFDVSTGVRFHPGEIILSMAIKFAAIAILGAAPIAVVVFEVVLNATSLFNHGNVGLPAAADRVLRLIVVTPDMHRVHHSIEWRETNSNFGFNVPWWDRIFGTYRAQPEAGHLGMVLGIDRFRDPVELRLDRMLWQPLRGDAGQPGRSIRR